MDMLAPLFENIERRALSVSELTSEIKSVLELGFGSVWVEGEISTFHSASSGHWYFSLTDGDSLLKAACYRGQNIRIRFRPSVGMQVRCRGRITLYEKRGEYQLLVESLEPVGEGAMAVAFEQIKDRLNREGLFDAKIKRPIPPFPRRVGIVTSPTGAAVHDIMTVLDRRARSVHIVVIPTLVQGEKAAEQIVDAIRNVNEYSISCAESERIDVLIVGRGGGSAEDLWAFNEEGVARAIRNSKIPVISAVGHEIDFTIADLAADLRAATPSAAAEIVAQSEAEVLRRIEQLSAELTRKIDYKLLSAHAGLQSLEMSPVFAEMPGRVREMAHRLRQASERLSAAALITLKNCVNTFQSVTGRLTPIRLSASIAESSELLSLLEYRAKSAATDLTSGRGRKLERAVARLDALSPLSVLSRGYSLTQKLDGEIVRNPHQTYIGETVVVSLAGGKIETKVTKHIQGKE